jgi:plastocyanin
MRRLGTFVLLTIIAAGVGAVGAAPKPRTHTVTIEGMRFDPETVTVARGDTIVWVNKDVVAHTATSDAAGFDSKIMQPEKSWRYKPAKRGRFPYVCTYHPTMVGVVQVE